MIPRLRTRDYCYLRLGGTNRPLCGHKDSEHKNVDFRAHE